MFEITIFTIVWGAVIGVLVSAPMGPTGILVIQRTLNKGRLPGLLTGLGASLSDFFYAVYLWKSNPASSLQNKDTSADSLSPRLKTSGILKNFLSGFGITVSNPFIIFFFIALFARTNFLFAASDYAIQSTVVRQAENKLRDLLNFDIFSLRTNVLQNTYNYSVARNSAKEKVSIGNFLDNTTVYIGKYLGSSLYVDAMLHVSFEDSDVNNIAAAGKMLFQPEFGMELESPFANIRVNMTPNINALLKNQFVPSTSVTLSWKYAF